MIEPSKEAIEAVAQVIVDEFTNDIGYPQETFDSDDVDDGTMPENVAELAEAVIGHRIVHAEKETVEGRWYGAAPALVLTLDDGTRVSLANTVDCCAYTELEEFFARPDMVDHAILGVGTTEGYTKWHIYADFGDVMELKVDWSCGNPFYYGYGFDIAVEPVADTAR
jgi:hypothetical protein